MLARDPANIENHPSQGNALDVKGLRKRCVPWYTSVHCPRARDIPLLNIPDTMPLLLNLITDICFCRDWNTCFPLGLIVSVSQTRAYGGGPPLVKAAAAAPRSAREGQLFFELALVWQELLSRFAVAREGRAQAQMLLTALKLAIAALRIAPLCPDGR